jgi:hypothetical protein
MTRKAKGEEKKGTNKEEMASEEENMRVLVGRRGKMMYFLLLRDTI